MSEKKEEKRKKEKTNQSAREIAEIMVENMKANMADPDFWIKKERIMQEVREKVRKNRDGRKKEDG